MIPIPARLPSPALLTASDAASYQARRSGRPSRLGDYDPAKKTTIPPDAPGWLSACDWKEQGGCWRHARTGAAKRTLSSAVRQQLLFELQDFLMSAGWQLTAGVVDELGNWTHAAELRAPESVRLYNPARALARQLEAA